MFVLSLDSIVNIRIKAINCVKNWILKKTISWLVFGVIAIHAHCRVIVALNCHHTYWSYKISWITHRQYRCSTNARYLRNGVEINQMWCVLSWNTQTHMFHTFGPSRWIYIQGYEIRSLCFVVISYWRIFTHRGRDIMAAIFRTTFSNAFSWTKMNRFQLGFHWGSN